MSLRPKRTRRGSDVLPRSSPHSRSAGSSEDDLLDLALRRSPPRLFRRHHDAPTDPRRRERIRRTRFAVLSSYAIGPSLGTPRSLLQRHRLDDDSVALSAIRLLLCSLECTGQQVAYRRLIQSLWALQDDVAHLISLSPQQIFRVPQSDPVSEEQADPTRKNRDRENKVRGSFRGTKADRQRVVVVVDELNRTGQVLAHFSQNSVYLGGDLRGE